LNFEQKNFYSGRKANLIKEKMTFFGVFLSKKTIFLKAKTMSFLIKRVFCLGNANQISFIEFSF